MSKTHGHGFPLSPTYSSWMSMKMRCLNPNRNNYSNYGGRGIKVCERWMKFENFLADMGCRPLNKSLDRIDNDGNYEPSNCRWATRKEQNINSRHFIHDEFSALPISSRAKCDLRKRKKGECLWCHQKAIGSLCEYHREKDRICKMQQRALARKKGETI